MDITEYFMIDPSKTKRLDLSKFSFQFSPSNNAFIGTHPDMPGYFYTIPREMVEIADLTFPQAVAAAMLQRRGPNG